MEKATVDAESRNRSLLLLMGCTLMWTANSMYLINL